MLRVSRWGSSGLFGRDSTFVDIDTENDTVIIIADTNEIGCLLEAIKCPSSYRWEERKVYNSDLGTMFVMQFNELKEQSIDFEKIGWYFWNVKNDILWVMVDLTPDDVNIRYMECYWFERIRK